MRKTAFANFKGGVGKTTAAVNVATALRDELRRADPDARILLADADSQAGATALLTGRSPSDTRPPWLPCSPANTRSRMRSFDWTIPRPGLMRKRRLPGGASTSSRRIRNRRSESPDPRTSGNSVTCSKTERLPLLHAILDCGYGDTDLTTLALVASDEIVVVTTVTALGVNGLEQLVGKVAKMRRSFPHLKIGGVLANDFSARETADQNVLDDMTKSLGELLWMPAIPHRAIVKRSHDARLPLSVFKVPAARALVEIYASVAQRLAPWRYLHDTHEAPWIRITLDPDELRYATGAEPNKEPAPVARIRRPRLRGQLPAERPRPRKLGKSRSLAPLRASSTQARRRSRSAPRCRYT